MNVTFDGVEYNVITVKQGRSKRFFMYEGTLLVGHGDMFSRTGTYHSYVRDTNHPCGGSIPTFEHRRTVKASARTIHNALKGGAK